jgi:hypothetical protein
MRHTVQVVKLVRILALVTVLVVPVAARADESDDVGRLVYTPGAGLRVGGTGLTIGGYGNATFTRDEGDPARFSLDELSLLLSWDPLPSLHVFSEIEGENLATIDDEGHGGLVDASFTVERLYGDVAVTDWLQLRAGKFLTPVGRWNVIHAAPLVWTTSRPLVTELTFDPHTTGGMVFGSLDPLLPDASYEIFGQFTDQFAPESTPQRADRSAGGRLDWGSAGGLELGGTYLAFEQGTRWKHLTGLDGLWHTDRVEIMGEFAYVAATQGTDQWGLYLQAVTELGAKVYLVGRYEHFLRASGGDVNLGVIGLAWKPWIPLVLKLEYVTADHRVHFEPPGLKGSVAFLF